MIHAGRTQHAGSLEGQELLAPTSSPDDVRRSSWIRLRARLRAVADDERVIGGVLAGLAIALAAFMLVCASHAVRLASVQFLP